MSVKRQKAGKKEKKHCPSYWSKSEEVSGEKIQRLTQPQSVALGPSSENGDNCDPITPFENFFDNIIMDNGYVCSRNELVRKTERPRVQRHEKCFLGVGDISSPDISSLYIHKGMKCLTLR